MENNTDTKSNKTNRQRTTSEGYDKISIQDYEDIVEYMKLDNPIKSKALIYSVLSGKDIEDINQMKVADMLTEYKKVTEFMNHEIDVNWKDSFMIDSIKYTPMLKFVDWETWRFQALITYQNEGNIAGVLAVMCKTPKEKELSYSQLQDKVALIKEKMPYGKAYSLYVFFCLLLETLHPHILTYSQEVQNRMEKMKANHLTNDGGGISL
jgi:hypothetical protein